MRARLLAVLSLRAVVALRSDVAFREDQFVSEAPALRHSRNKGASMCRKPELSAGDDAMRRHESPRRDTQAARDWRALFRTWNGKKVLLAGDSLMDQQFQVVSCAAELMGFDVHFSNVVRFEWAKGAGKLVNISTMPWLAVGASSKRNRNTQALIFRATISSDDGHLDVDYLRYYSFTGECQSCAMQEGAFVSLVDTVAIWAQKYDYTYLNLGHDMVRDNQERIAAKAAAFCKAYRIRQGAGKLILMEHPPQHFQDKKGTGNSGGRKKLMRCECNLPSIDNQTVARNNAVLSKVARQSGIKLAGIWHLLARRGCDLHRPPDCTHFHISPELWAPIATAMKEATKALAAPSLPAKV